MKHLSRRMTGHREAGTASLETLLCLPFVLLIFALVLDIGYGWVVRLRADAAVRYAGTTYVNLLSAGTEPATAERDTEEELRRTYYRDGEDFQLEIATASLAPQAPPSGPTGEVWANPDSMIFHRDNDRWYGRTRRGRFMTEEEALREGYRAAKWGWWSGRPSEGISDLGAGIHEYGGELSDSSLLGTLETLGSRLSGRNDLLLIVPRHVPTGTLLPDNPLEVEFSLDGNTWTYAEVPIGFKALTDAGKTSNLPVRIISLALKGLFWLLGMEA
jgi:TadE-like protein